MRAYELRRGHGKNVEGDKVLVSFGAIDRMLAWTDGKKLYVDMTMKAGVADDIATETITRNNRFLERATGYSAKERSKKAQDAAKKGTA